MTRDTDRKMDKNSRLLMLLAAVLLLAAFELPIWSISLNAPQYPEGMGLQIWMSDIKGATRYDLQKINNLNHYIGMKKIHPEEMIELRIFPGLLAALAALEIAAAASGRRWLAKLSVACFCLFGAVGMSDMYVWGYSYGHTLDPEAPIKVPGMSYQPPLIGTKKLLNFTATSLPATGGLVLLLAGGMACTALLLDGRRAEHAF